MARVRVELTVQPRTEFGSAVSRRLRRDGLVPGVIYGAGKAATAFVVDAQDLRRTFAGASMNSIFDVVFTGSDERRHAVVKDYQMHATRGTVVHLDMHEIPLDRPIQTTVPVEAIGAAPGVARGGLLTVAMRDVAIEGLPMNLPDRIEVDVSGLDVGGTVKVSDLPLPDGITALAEADATVVVVSATRVARALEREGAGIDDAEATAEAREPAPEAEADAPESTDGEDESPSGDDA